MVGDGWKWQINKNTFRQGGRINKTATEGQTLSDQSAQEKTRPRREAPFSCRKWIESWLNIILAIHYFYILRPHDAIPSELQGVQQRQGLPLMEWMWAEARIFIRQSNILFFAPYTCAGINMGRVGVCETPAQALIKKTNVLLLPPFPEMCFLIFNKSATRGVSPRAITCGITWSCWNLRRTGGCWFLFVPLVGLLNLPA